MDDKFSYQSGDYNRQSQRFVIPLYIKDALGNYQYSSTGTLVKYDGHHYIIFAAHASPNDDSLESIYTFGIDGDFSKIKDIAIGHQFFVEDDIVIVDCFNKTYDGKNYFNLDLNALVGFEKRCFAWTGFPSSKSKSKKVHNTKSKESLKKQYVHSDESGNYFKNASYFTIVSKIKSNNKQQITGTYDRKNASLKYKGNVSMAPHPEGMSGGAMYFFSKNQELKDSLDDTFRFAGIGIEYKKDNTIVGVPKIKIIQLIEQFNIENPLMWSLTDSKAAQSNEKIIS
ncbi:hypothetical protein Sden_3271 [Shewanella denitrificans OS217]|uniref:Uncharacterized protein n=1 Tax=Shewanella denitrificans (strain OS217 / ATCC BAA-1090 / DSM 15013) TaxID=318161 RepID=Q12J29_SHEDO|nr:hypothetical protein [Shewanella denitrificans]ABE56547.1 hypothetical protein Sden_3271 [Shewanella denitrificans OS217]